VHEIFNTLCATLGLEAIAWLWDELNPLLDTAPLPFMFALNRRLRPGHWWNRRTGDPNNKKFRAGDGKGP